VEIEMVRAAIYAALAAEHPATVRQVFYRLVTTGAIAKTEAEYKSTVVRLLTAMRREGRVPYHWIADNTRWMRKSQSYNSLEDALYRTAQTYRRAVWAGQPAYVEVWLEKDALAGVLLEVTDAWDVPLMVTRGYPSLTFLHSAAEQIADAGKPAFLYYFGDYDPSGVDIARKVEVDLRTLAPTADLSFERIAVTPAQISAWGLPTRPTKRTDARAKHFEGESVEVDAIPPDQLRALTTAAIVQHVDDHAVDLLRTAEQSERELLYAIASRAPRSRPVA
jgi:Protein of unknown function C-terminus (DUF2399)